ncbi:MAG: hypothetical protein GY845_39380 [Planctomycetes bacterium]|nr:hypothetical protein [Planctomycetota bacterium]
MIFEGDGNLQISEVTRQNLLDELILLDENQPMSLWGKLDLVEFLGRIWPLDNMPSTDSRFKTASGDIWQHMINNDDWNYQYLFSNYLGLIGGTDEQFFRFIEQLVHPLVRRVEKQEEYVSVVNSHLERDGFRLEVREKISGYPVYRAVRIEVGVQEKVKNLIFAADGPKPEIVLSDSLSNEIQIMRNAEYCLVYNQPIRDSGLYWSDLIKWWSDRNKDEAEATKVEENLYRRLQRSLQSEPERLLFKTYFKEFHKLGGNFPALIPQVYLHYDPYTFRELKGSKRLPRQRMDFLILFSNHERIVIEVDGKQHYADDSKASPRKYAEMVAADRELRLAGYEIYRFGGYELQESRGSKLVKEFFCKLLQKHGIATN